MTENEIVVAIVFGSIVGIVVMTFLFSLAKTWINRNNSSYDEEKFDRLAKAFIRHKKETERRLKKLEPGAGEQKVNAKTSKKTIKEKRLQDATQIKPDSEQTKPNTESGNLRNMLNE